ncbi:hypothetical protein [Alicyclobacillus mengziensis]|uniref:Uncharacterized protein n=1 Tax=Alicyclobacillus mengziensis TaxID=2931921 RepID=A0A9X7Z9V9_9BACL|nr:hypothetical protein [Alicyclobacillus mengziensis]QSO50101.1 hypothetical protein JZ786_24610 [Alicyclobacillus mengziensis]
MPLDLNEIRVKNIVENADWHELATIIEQHDKDGLAHFLSQVGATSSYAKTSFDCREDLLQELHVYCKKNKISKKLVINAALELFLLTNPKA